MSLDKHHNAAHDELWGINDTEICSIYTRVYEKKQLPDNVLLHDIGGFRIFAEWTTCVVCVCVCEIERGGWGGRYLRISPLSHNESIPDL